MAAVGEKKGEVMLDNLIKVTQNLTVQLRTVNENMERCFNLAVTLLVLCMWYIVSSLLPRAPLGSAAVYIRGVVLSYLQLYSFTANVACAYHLIQLFY